MNGWNADCSYAVALDTSTARGSIALGRGAEILEARAFAGARQHAVEFLPCLAAVCRAHGVAPPEIRRVYVSIGPGSFTGLRIGLTAARIIALATGASIAGVGTLEVIAQNAAEMPGPPQQVAVILDAKRKRVYGAAFQWKGGKYLPDGEPAEVEPGTFLASQTPTCVVLGEGAILHPDAVNASGLTILPESLFAPRAKIVYRLGMARAVAGALIDRRSLTPHYVRPPEAEERWARRHAT